MSETFKGFGLNIVALPENDEKLAEWEREQEKYREQARYEAYRKSGVPDKFLKSNFDTFLTETEEEKKAKLEVALFAKNPGNKVLLLCGKNGNGKTHLACAVERECGGEYITASMLCVKYESAKSFKAKMSIEELIDHYAKVKGVLVIDECGKYFVNSELEKFLLVTIVCMRYENGLPTILVTNADKKPFVEFLGKAVYDRFTEVCSTVEFNWESKRKGRRSV